MIRGKLELGSWDGFRVLGLGFWMGEVKSAMILERLLEFYGDYRRDPFLHAPLTTSK